MVVMQSRVDTFCITSSLYWGGTIQTDLRCCQQSLTQSFKVVVFFQFSDWIHFHFWVGSHWLLVMSLLLLLFLVHHWFVPTTFLVPGYDAALWLFVLVHKLDYFLWFRLRSGCYCSHATIHRCQWWFLTFDLRFFLNLSNLQYSRCLNF